MESDIIQLIKNKSFSDFVSEKVAMKNSLPPDKCFTCLIQLSQALPDQKLQKLVKSSDVLTAIKTFCKGIKLQEKHVASYIKAITVILDYFNFVNDADAQISLHAVMTLSKPPLHEINGAVLIHLYNNYLIKLGKCNLKFSEQFFKDLSLSILELLKHHKKTYFNIKYVEGLLKIIYFLIKKLSAIMSRNMLLSDFIKECFDGILNCNIKGSDISIGSYKILCMILEINTEICIENKADLVIIKSFPKIIKDVDDKGSANILISFHNFLAKSQCDDDLVHIICRLNDKIEYNNIINNYIKPTLIRYISKIQQQIVEENFAYKLFTLAQAISRKPTNLYNCPICPPDSHQCLNVQQVSTYLIAKFITRDYKKMVPEIHRFFSKFVLTAEENWNLNCPQKLDNLKKCIKTFSKTIHCICKTNNDSALPAECITLVQDIMFQIIKTFAKKLDLFQECLSDFKILFKILANAYKNLNEINKACAIYLLGIHFTKQMQFNYIFCIRHNNEDCTDSSYDILMNNSLIKHLGIVLEKKDYLYILFQELKEFHEFWISRNHIRQAVKNIKYVANDPLTLAKACLFLKSISVDDLDIINSTIQLLESNMKYFKGKTLLFAQMLLGTLYGMKYLAEDNKYANEVSQTTPILNAIPVSDRDGLKHADDTCDINPVDPKINLEEESKIVLNVVNAIKYWASVIHLDSFKNDITDCNIYLKLTLCTMEKIIVGLHLRGSNDSLAFDLMMLSFKLAKNLQDPIMALQCVSRLINSLSYSEEIEKINLECNSYVYEVLKNDDSKENDKIFAYDYLLSYVEYLLNCKNLDKAYFYGISTIERMKSDTIDENLLFTRIHWIQALFKAQDNSPFQSLLYLYGLCFDNLASAAAVDAGKNYYHINSCITFELALRVGKYTLSIHQTRMTNYYLRSILRYAQKLGFIHRIVEIMCILLRTDIVSEKYADAQVKINVLADIMYHSQKSQGGTKRKIVEGIKKVILSPTNGAKTLISPEAYRDSVVCSEPSLLRLADIGSPPLAHRTLKLPEIFSHNDDCKCIHCYEKAYYSLILSATSLEARLNCFLGKTNVAYKFFTICNKIREAYKKNSKSNSINNLHVYNHYKINEFYSLYDQCLHIAKNDEDYVTRKSFNVEKQLLKDIKWASPELLQEYMTLLLSFHFTKYVKNSNCYLNLITDEEYRLTPKKLVNELAFKTPAACTRFTVGGVNKKPKFKIHEDVSPTNLNIPALKFNLVDCEDNDCDLKNKPKSSSHSGHSATSLSTVDKKQKSKTVSDVSSSKSIPKTCKKLNSKPLDNSIFDVYKTPLDKTKSKLTLEVDVEGSGTNSKVLKANSISLDKKLRSKSASAKVQNVQKSQDIANCDAFEKCNKSKKVKAKNTSAPKIHVSPLTHIKSSDSSDDEVFATPMKFPEIGESSKDLQKDMHKRQFKRIVQPFKNSNSSQDDDEVFLPCEKNVDILNERIKTINLNDNKKSEKKIVDDNFRKTRKKIARNPFIL